MIYMFNEKINKYFWKIVCVEKVGNSWKNIMCLMANIILGHPEKWLYLFIMSYEQKELLEK